MTNRYKPEAAVIAQAAFYNRIWTDEAFAARLESDPKAVLAEMGSQLADDLEIKVVRDSETVKHLHIPAAPLEGEISEVDLMQAQGGVIAVQTIPMPSVVPVPTISIGGE